MNTVALALTLLLAADTTALVDLARETKAKRKKSTTKVITNEDVRKSKGKIHTTAVPDTPVTREPTLMEKHEARRAAEAAAAERKAAAEAVIAGLEKELAAIEQSYYSENDLHKRDTEIVRRFNEVKARLDAARAVLDGLKPVSTSDGLKPVATSDGSEPVATDP